ncbi:hypothetical protein [Streptomyces sp. NPDC003717]|uniref:hypothetical protein n=1 Tax=Streptomyces sp. NPDC003717 TaxID=3154276 RepID=UPI0033B07FA8
MTRSITRSARDEWRRDGVALLRCGGPISAVRIDGSVVRSASGTDVLPDVDRYLAKALLGGPVFMEQDLGRYYVLVGDSAGRCSDWRLPRDDVRFLGDGSLLGVPDTTSTHRGMRCYWCVEPGGPHALAGADAVSQLVHTGRHRILNCERSRMW